MSYTALTSFELANYFARINFSGAPAADLLTLRQLHYLHAIAIPFENLSSWSGSSPSLEEAAVYDKLVRRQRGGYCFEQNQLMLRALLTLGFTVHPMAARVLMAGSALPRTHMVLLVLLDGQRYLVDVGFGGMTMTAPMDLDLGEAQATSHGYWRVEAHPSAYMLHGEIQGNWQPKYCFGLEYQTPGDYLMANWYVSTYPESRFITDLIAARPDAQGRHALLNRRYTYHRLGAESEERELESPDQLLTVLRDAFLINLRECPDLPQLLQQRLFTS